MKKQKMKSRLMQRFLMVLIVMIVLVTGGMSALIYMNTHRIIETTAMENNYLHMEYILEYLDLQAYEDLANNPVEGELYEQLQQQLTEFLDKTKLTYLYVIIPGLNGEDNQVLVDAGDLTGDDTYFIGDVADEVVYDDTLEMLEKEGMHVEMVTYEGWEDYLSVYAPLKNAAGETFAIIAADEVMDMIAQTKADAVKTILPMILLMTTMLSFAVIALIFLYVKKLLRPIEQIRQATLNLVYGNIKRTEQLMEDVVFKGTDEISRFGQVYKSSVDSLGDVIKQSLNMMKGVNDSTETIQRSTRFISKEQPKVSSGVAIISNGVQNQKQVAEKSAYSIGQMHEGVQQISGSVSQVVDSMHTMSSLIKENAEDAQKTSAHVLATADKVVKTKNNMQELSARYATIEDMVRIIQDIAKKTSSLALNASMESSHSGEVGKGFKIVASEVKKLANVTAQSADSIYEHIRTFKKVTRDVVENMEKTTREVQNNAQLVTHISSDLSGLLISAEDVQERIDHVNDLMKQVESNSETVMRVLQETSNVSNGVLADTEDVVTAMQQQQASLAVLQHTVDELSDYVNKLNRLTELYTV